MATNNEIAAFEDFKFQIGDMVRMVAEKVATNVITEEAERQGAMAKITPLVGMVVLRWLAQDESGISRLYSVKGVEFGGKFKEFEIETVITSF